MHRHIHFAKLVKGIANKVFPPKFKVLRMYLCCSGLIDRPTICCLNTETIVWFGVPDEVKTFLGCIYVYVLLLAFYTLFLLPCTSFS
ncbi:hypothetical protein AYI69_g809 [Smittium culicis]|uniref:Uncharacterized protein n=1 Tax=Smittium culicis TaxID=133412 RepID=A0A1R1YSB9_9FUNG|nr:hypothetical protein AYI69_g809 [Smittium culicis]